MISLIVAKTKNNVIGKSNALPWYLPADLRRFRQLTTGHSVIMGRKTFDSIITKLGKPLPNRTNIVVTRQSDFAAPGAVVTHSLPEALQAANEDEVFIIGGAEIYQQALPLADRIYLTEIDAAIAGDTFFPPLVGSWHEVSRESHARDEKNPHDYAFITLEKR